MQKVTAEGKWNNHYKDTRKTNSPHRAREEYIFDFQNSKFVFAHTVSMYNVYIMYTAVYTTEST